jgi:chromosomal replication initiator protein
MIDKEFEQQWQQVCAELREISDDGLLHECLSQIEPSIQDNTLVLSVPSRFMYDWLQRKEYDVSLFNRVQRFIPSLENKNVRLQDYHAAASVSLPSSEVAEKTQVVRTPNVQPADSSLDEVRLNPAMTFESFVVGSSNELAYAVAKGVTERFDPTRNPVFLHSSVGLGKTHLMNAIAWRIKEKNPGKKVLYLTAEQFLRRYVRAMRGDQIQRPGDDDETENFRELFRSADVLMIDDVQFFCSGKKQATQMEFFHTFNSLIEQGKQIILSSDSSPLELKGMEERLKSRMAQGLIVDIYPTTYEMRIGILQSKAEQWGYSLPQSVADFLAENITSNVRELEGALKRLLVNSQLLHLPLTVASAQQILKDILNLQPQEVSVSDILNATCEHFMIKLSDLKSARRDRSIARPRQIAMYLAKEMTTKSLPEIGAAFGRDHTTIMHAVKQISSLINTDPTVAEHVRFLKRSFKC